MSIYYGIETYKVNITELALNSCISGYDLIIPAGDSDRAALFGDPIGFVVKSIFITDADGNTNVYDANTIVNIKNFIPDPTAPQK